MRNGSKSLKFLKKTQPEIVEKYNLEQDGIDREKFLSALQSKIEKKGIVETLRKEFYYLNDSITLFYAFLPLSFVLIKDKMNPYFYNNLCFSHKILKKP